MRVYVLGAGASAHAGYPLAGDLGTRLATWIETLPQGHYLRTRLSQFTDASGKLDDFEAVIADLITCRPGSLAAGLPSGERSNLRRDLQRALREYFNTIRDSPAPLYDQLSGNLSPGDVVITFNYDLGLERALVARKLWNIETGYGFAIGNVDKPSPIDVLKLHGSTNWGALLFGSGRPGLQGKATNSLGDRPVLFFRPDLEYLGLPRFVDPLCARLDTAADLPAMILPVLPKQFYYDTSFGQEWKPFWDHIWSGAHSAIENAYELIVIGYSLPDVDVRARKLLLETSNKDVLLTVCCGDATASLEAVFRCRGFRNSRRIPDPTFSGFLSSQTA